LISTLKFQFWIIIFDFHQFWSLLIESKNAHFNFENCYLNLKVDIWILKFLFKFKKRICSKNWYLNSKLLIFNLKISISIQKTIIESKFWHLDFEYFYLIFGNSILNFLFKFFEIIWHETLNLNSKLLSWILKINISIKKTSNWVLKWTFQFWI